MVYEGIGQNCQKLFEFIHDFFTSDIFTPPLPGGYAGPDAGREGQEGCQQGDRPPQTTDQRDENTVRKV